MNEQTQVSAAIVRTPAQWGAHLAESVVLSRDDWREAFKQCKTATKRAEMRREFVATMSDALIADGMDADKARTKATSAFDYRAAEFAPASTSRKSAALKRNNGGKTRRAGGGRKSKSGPVVKQGDAAQYNAAALAYIARMQRKHAGDDEMLEVLGAIAAILAGGKGRK